MCLVFKLLLSGDSALSKATHFGVDYELLIPVSRLANDALDIMFPKHLLLESTKPDITVSTSPLNVQKSHYAEMRVCRLSSGKGSSTSQITVSVEIQCHHIPRWLMGLEGLTNGSRRID